MPSYVVTGASRGLGLEFIRQLSDQQDSVVIGLVRNKRDTEKRLGEDAWRKNLHVIEADLQKISSLQKAADAVGKVTGGSLDYLIGNAAWLGGENAFRTLTELQPDVLKKQLDDAMEVNVVGNVYLINTFLPLLRQSNTKKIAMISTGMADLDLINTAKETSSSAYSMSKAALNVAVAKYNAELSGEGFLFMSISPGVVDTGGMDSVAQEDMPKLLEQAGKMKTLAPHWEGPITPEVSVRMVMKVLEEASVEKGNGGTFVSHFGNNKQWI